MDDRKHLTAGEVDKLLTATKGTRNEARDRCLLLLMFRHGLRVSAACGLVLSQVDTESRILHVKRLKDGLSTTHPFRGDEIRAIKTWLAERARMKPETDAFFISERHSPLSRKTAWLMIRDYSRLAGLPVEAHPVHAAPCVRLCLGRPERGYAADSRLSRAPEYSAHRQVHGHQPGTV